MSPYIDDRPVNQRLKVRRYDRVASSLVLLLIVGGFLDALMLLIWLTPVLEMERAPTVVLPARASGVAQDVGRVKDQPNLNELSQFAVNSRTEKLLLSVSHAVAATQEMWERLPGANSNVEGPSDQDPRQAGPNQKGDDVVPAWERWELKYDTSDLPTYARQLDAFGIELAAVGGGISHVDYASSFMNFPRKRKGKSSDEDRVYFVWTNRSIRKLDEALMDIVEVPTRNRIICQFIPKELEQKLLEMELRHAAKEMAVKLDLADEENVTKVAETVAKTMFGVRRRDGKYEFFVIKQQAR